jgi:small-conductance mechanosensitive channel
MRATPFVNNVTTFIKIYENLQPMKTRDSFCQTFGLHSVVGFSLFAIDSLLIASEVATFEATWILTIPIALVLTIFAILLQKRLYGDSWRAALFKGSVVGVLTAIPLPIASLTTLLGGVFGTARNLFVKKADIALSTSK